MDSSGQKKLYTGLASALLPLVAIAGPPAFQESSDASRLYDQAARQAQYLSLQGVGTAEIEYGKYGRLRSITGRTGILVDRFASIKEGDSATAILDTLKPMLMATTLDTLKVRKVVHAFGAWTIFMDQSIDGIPILDGGVNVRVNESGEVILVSSLFVPADPSASRKPQLSAEAAISRLKEQLLASSLREISASPATEARLAYWTDRGQEQEARLVWQVHASHMSEDGSRAAADYAVDATSGDVVYLQRQTFGLNRTTYTLNYANNLNFGTYPTPLTLLWNEGAANPSNVTGYSIYEKSVPPRNTWAAVGLNYDNFSLVANHPFTNGSWWNKNSSGHPFLVFGDFMAGESDAVSHEYGHGIFFPLAGPEPWQWWYDYYAINEFYGDLSAVITEINAGASPQIAQTWQMTTQNVRNLANPKSIPAPDFRDWYPSRRFYGFTDSVAYSNSTIFGHALYLMIHGGSHVRAGQSDLHGPIPTFAITPTPASTVLSIFAQALLNLGATHTSPSGINLKAATVAAATAIAGPAVATQVNNAWTAVGIGFGCSAPPPTPNPTITPWYCRGTHDITWAQTSGDNYHGMVVPPGGVWDLVGYTNIDIPASSCQTNVTGTLKFRMRACNGCGCSNWTSDYYMYYYNPCL